MLKTFSTIFLLLFVPFFSIAILIFLSSFNIVNAQENPVSRQTISPTETESTSLNPTESIDSRITTLQSREIINAEADRMFDRIDKMLMWILGIGTIFLAIVSLLGGFLVWKSERIQKQAQDDLDDIRTSKKQVEKVVAEVKTSQEQLIKNISSVTLEINDSLKNAKTINQYKEIAQNSLQAIEAIQNNVSASGYALGTISPSDFISPSDDPRSARTLSSYFTQEVGNLEGARVAHSSKIESLLNRIKDVKPLGEQSRENLKKE